MSVMASPVEVASRIAEWRRRDEREHPDGLYELVLEWMNDLDEEVRYEAVMFVSRHLRQLSDAQPLLEMAVAHTAGRLCQAALDARGGLVRNTHDRRRAQVVAGRSLPC